ncbi:hypothetical protein MPLB_160016 [Mesorhizobium sp. ORS 3324]|nr:hypothetical protein MPLB_160016 [Mesorhizobium sp. ORS 3324]
MPSSPGIGTAMSDIGGRPMRVFPAPPKSQSKRPILVPPSTQQNFNHKTEVLANGKPVCGVALAWVPADGTKLGLSYPIKERSLTRLFAAAA